MGFWYRWICGLIFNSCFFVVLHTFFFSLPIILFDKSIQMRWIAANVFTIWYSKWRLKSMNDMHSVHTKALQLLICPAISTLFVYLKLDMCSYRKYVRENYTHIYKTRSQKCLIFWNVLDVSTGLKGSWVRLKAKTSRLKWIVFREKFYTHRKRERERDVKKTRRERQRWKQIKAFVYHIHDAEV